MTPCALPWLPAAAPGTLERQLVAIADDWAAQWFETAPACQVEPDRAARRRAVRWSGCTEAAAGAAQDDLVALGHAAVADQADATNSRDREVLKAIGLRALADLALALCQIVGASSAAGDMAIAPNAAGDFYCLGTAKWTVAIFLGASAQIRLRRRVAGARQHPKLRRLSEALAPEVVTLGCHLGRASLSAADLTALSKGDLIVLDRRIADRLPLTVEGAIAARGAASIDSAGETLSIRITDPIDLTAGSD